MGEQTDKRRRKTKDLVIRPEWLKGEQKDKRRRKTKENSKRAFHPTRQIELWPNVLYNCFYTISNILFHRSRIGLDPSFWHCVSNIQYNVIMYVLLYIPLVFKVMLLQRILTQYVLLLVLFHYIHWYIISHTLISYHDTLNITYFHLTRLKHSLCKNPSCCILDLSKENETEGIELPTFRTAILSVDLKAMPLPLLKTFSYFCPS